MRNRLARRVIKSRVAWVLILAMFLNTFSIQAAYAAGEIAVPEETAALEEAEEPAVEKEEGETEGKTRLAANYTGDAAWLNDWTATVSENNKTVTLSKYTPQTTSDNIIIPAKVSIGAEEYTVKLSENSSSMFSGHTEIKTISFNKGVDTSAVKSMESMFYGCENLTSVDLTNINTSMVTNMKRMFYGCKNLTGIDFTNINTSEVTDMSELFFGCEKLTSVDLTGINTGKVTDMMGIFNGCKNLTSLDISDISTNNVKNMSYMFNGCQNLTCLNLSGISTNNVTEMSCMFCDCQNLTNLDVSGFNTSKLQNVVRMFNNCKKLTYLNLKNFNMVSVNQVDGFLSNMSGLETIETPTNLTTYVDLPGYFFDESAGPEQRYSTLPMKEAVSKTYIKYIAVTGISVSPDKLLLATGENATLSADVVPKNATEKELTYTWSSDDPDVAVVDGNGKVTGLANGETTIKVSANNLEASCTVSVNGEFVPVESVTVTASTNHIKAGEKVGLSANVLPVNATNKSVTWSSDKENIATVDDHGIVTGVAEGTATITARTSNDISANCVITVSNNTVKPVGITLNPKAKTISPNETFHISANVLPANATDKSVTWLTNDKTVAVVDTNGNVKGKKTGKATITAKTFNGITATCAVTVSDNTVQPVSITLKPETKTISVNETFHISANVLPANATDKTVTWTSSKDGVATVDEDGNVTGITEGDAIITASTSNGKTKTCKVMVRGYKTIPVTGITVSPEILAIAVGDSSYITPTVYPLNATDKRVTWKSSSVSVAAVDKNGRVTGKAPGTAVITATAGGFSAECLVTVKKSAVRRPYSGLDPRLFYQAEKTADTYKAELVKGQKYSLGKGVWTTTDPKTVSVKKKTGVLTAKKAGTAKLTNTSGKTTAFNMTVYEPKLAVTSVTVLVGDIVNVSIRNTGSLPVSWVSGDIHKASVIMNEEDDNRAVITGVGKGKTRVYAYVNGKAFPVTVNVRDQAASRTLAANDSIRINAFNPVALKYISRDFKPSKVIKWSDTAGLEWRKDSKGNRTDHTGAVTISKGGKVTGNTAADSSPVIAMGRDSNGNSVVLEITVDAIPVKTDLYMNVGQTASLKHSYVKNSDRVRWIYDNKNINLSNADKVKTRIKALAAGEGTATCRYQDMDYYTYVHVEDPEVITEGGMKRTKPSAYNYTLSLKKGDSFDIGMSGVYQDVLWRSNKQGVAFVDEYGRISARGRGRATLSTTVNKRKLKINVTVTD